MNAEYLGMLVAVLLSGDAVPAGTFEDRVIKATYFATRIIRETRKVAENDKEAK